MPQRVARRKQTNERTRYVSIALAFGALRPPIVAQYVAPPPEVIATLTPVYHEGHSVYYWQGHWHYKGKGTAWENADHLDAGKLHPRDAAAAKASAAKAEAARKKKPV